jgi:hypothetical protein
MSGRDNGVVRRYLPWREMSRTMRILKMLSLVGWAAAMASLLTLGGIETVALKQPKEPDGIYQHPYDINGRIRYLTGTQDRMIGVAHPALIVFGVWFVLSGAGYEILRRADYKRRMQAFSTRPAVRT